MDVKKLKRRLICLEELKQKIIQDDQDPFAYYNGYDLGILQGRILEIRKTLKEIEDLKLKL